MIECKNDFCKRKFELHQKVIYNLEQVERFKKEIFSNYISYNVDVQCPFCDRIFAIPIEKFFEVRHKDDLKRIERVRSLGIREILE